MDNIYDDKLINRFLVKIEIGENDNDCWKWLGAFHSKLGYGSFCVHNKKKEKAHRISFEIFNNRKIKEGMHILHSCDNPNCVNPKHLSEGTHQDNMDDKVSKNRQSRLNGEQIGTSKLTKEQVDLIRNKFNLDGVSQASLSREFGIHHSNIHRIVNFKSWI